ncbi:Origin recognition complex subunit 1 [Mycena kentingensis (nom. inval.)]|nr:Origin recognition complex subunit 1 [Mycena kentingensis (nom. inval.)]
MPSASQAVPYEILSYIFILASADHWGYPYKNHPPLTLAGVCSTWRSVALGTPVLWERLRVTTGQTPDKTFVSRPSEDAITAWLSRGRVGRIALAVHFSGCHRAFTTDISDRIGELHLMKPTLECIELFLVYGGAGTYPVLHTLKIIDPSDSLANLPLDLDRVLVLPLLPASLKDFTIRRGIITNVRPDSITATWNRLLGWSLLTSLRLDGDGTYGQACTILLQCSALIRCYLSFPGADAHITVLASGTRPHVLINLTTLVLRLSSVTNHNLANFFARFSLPALHTLSLARPSARSSWRSLRTSGAPSTAPLVHPMDWTLPKSIRSLALGAPFLSCLKHLSPDALPLSVLRIPFADVVALPSDTNVSLLAPQLEIPVLPEDVPVLRARMGLGLDSRVFGGGSADAAAGCRTVTLIQDRHRLMSMGLSLGHGNRDRDAGTVRRLAADGEQARRVRIETATEVEMDVPFPWA